MLFIVGGIFAGLILLSAGILWSHRTIHHPGKINVSPFENDMVEGLVRGILQENGIRDAPVCFVSFGETATPPSSAFPNRFADCHHPAVQGVNTSVSPPINRFFEKDNGRPGIIIQIISIHQYIATVFDITVSLSNLPRGHDRVIYRVSNATGDWIIKKRTPV